MAGKCLRAAEEMNFCVAALLCFAVLGVLDEGLGGKLGVVEDFRRGIASMGPLCLSMAGIYCMTVKLTPYLAEMLQGKMLPFDPSLPAGMLLACDLGGWAAARILAADPQLAVFSGLLAASTVGCLISFVLPVSMGSLKSYEKMGFMQGIVWGVITLPAALLGGGVVLGLSVRELAQNLWPVIVLCAVFCAALRFVPRVCVGVLVAVGEIVRWLGLILFCVVVFGLFAPEHAVVEQALIEEVLVIVLRITAVVCGSLVASRLLLAKCGSWIGRAAALLGVNDYAVLGLLASLVSNLSMLPLYSKMDVRGKVMNAAFTVSGVFILGGQMGFVANAADSRGMCAYFVTKLIGGILAVLLASLFTKAQPQAAAAEPEAEKQNG